MSYRTWSVTGPVSKFSSDRQKKNLDRLRRSIRLRGGDVSGGFRRFTAATTKDIAETLSLPRQSVEQCLRKSGGREYPHVRRALEAEYGLPPFSLDKLL